MVFGDLRAAVDPRAGIAHGVGCSGRWSRVQRGREKHAHLYRLLPRDVASLSGRACRLLPFRIVGAEFSTG